MDNEYNLSVSSYVEAEDVRECIDIAQLNTEILQLVAHQDVLRKEINRLILEIEGK